MADNPSLNVDKTSLSLKKRLVAELNNSDWGERTNVIRHFKSLLVGGETFGTCEPGCFARMDYVQDNWLKGNDVRKEDMQLFIERIVTSKSLITLRYFEGRKFTFGNTYKSRDSQDEFIYLNIPEDLFPERKEEYFRLEIKSNCLWLYQNSENGSSITVCVNGIAIGGDGNENEHIINFGDIVTIYTKSGYCDLVFLPVRKHALPRIDSVSNYEVHHALRLDVVMEKILGFLPTNQLKDIRLVSQFWNKETLREIVLRKNKMNLSICLTGSDCTYDQIIFSEFAESQLFKLDIPNWTIKLPEDGSSLTHDTVQHHKIQMRDEKILDDLNWLLNPLHSRLNIHSLTLSGRLDSDIRLRTFKNVLSSLKNTLVKLMLSIGVPTATWTSHLIKWNEIPDLRFMFLSHIDGMDGNICPVEIQMNNFKQFFKQFLPAVRRIKTLHMGAVPPDYEITETILSEIANLQAADGEMFSTLTNMALCRDYSCNFKHLERIRQNTIKNLTIGGINPDESEEILLVLQRQSETLEHLTLYYDFSCSDKEGNIIVYFPTKMPKLRSLSVLYQSTVHANWLELIDMSLGPPCIMFGTHTGYVADNAGDTLVNVVDYEKCFPLLTELTVYPAADDDFKGYQTPLTSNASWADFGPILLAFIKTTDTEGRPVSIPSIHNLNIPFLLNGMYCSILDNLELTFPNVQFPPALAEARRGPVSSWNDDSDSDQDM